TTFGATMRVLRPDMLTKTSTCPFFQCTDSTTQPKKLGTRSGSIAAQSSSTSEEYPRINRNGWSDSISAEALVSSIRACRLTSPAQAALNPSTYPVAQRCCCSERPALAMYSANDCSGAPSALAIASSGSNQSDWTNLPLSTLR